MSASTKTITRGQYVFTVSVTRELRQQVLDADGQMVATGKQELIASTEINVTKDGKFFDRGILEVFSDLYKASPNYQRSFANFPTKPASRLGDMFLSDEATAELSSAIDAATADAMTPEIESFVAAKKAREQQNRIESAEYEAHVKAVENMMTLGGKSM